MKPCVIITSSYPLIYDSVLSQEDCGQCDVVINKKDEPLGQFLSRVFETCSKKLEPADIIILLHNKDRLAGPHSIARILDVFDKNSHIVAAYTDSQEMVDGFAINRYMPAYYNAVTNILKINTPIAFKANLVRSLPIKFENVYHDLFVAATNRQMGHHIPEPLFICQR